MNEFADHIQRLGLTEKTIAKQLSINQSTVNRLKTRDFRPSLKLAASIEKWSKGKVPMSVWVNGK